MNDIRWTNFIVETFLEKLKDRCLDPVLYDDICEVTRARARHVVRSVLAEKMGMSVSTLDVRIRQSREYYDEIQALFPELGLPVRKPSKEEDYMDNH